MQCGKGDAAKAEHMLTSVVWIKIDPWLTVLLDLQGRVGRKPSTGQVIARKSGLEWENRQIFCTAPPWQSLARGLSPTDV
jgi:hypothetical protein